ncbi:MAG: Obg family GTPase CgtA, partial [Actinomycetota bacterium]
VEPARVEEVSGTFGDHGLDVVAISAAHDRGLDLLTERLAALVEEWREKRNQPLGFELFATQPNPVTVTREGELWRVSGGAVERWVAMTDLSNPEAVSYLQVRLERAGVEDLLARAGAEHGDDVRIGRSVFSWWPKNSAPEGFLRSVE